LHLRAGRPPSHEGALYLDTAACDAASREQDKIERENLRRVGMLAR